MILALAGACWLVGCMGDPGAATYKSEWGRLFDGAFAGPEIWTNPLQDWRVRDGALECFVAGRERNVFLLTHELNDRSRELRMRVSLERLTSVDADTGAGYAGFRFGVRGRFADYRDSAIRGQGTKAGITAAGRLFIGNIEGDRVAPGTAPLNLELTASADGDLWQLRLLARDGHGNVLGRVARSGLASSVMLGGVGLACHSGDLDTRELAGDGTELRRARDTRRGGRAHYAFRDWTVGGRGLTIDAARGFGPIAFTLYTVDRQVLKLTAQMLPVAPDGGQQVVLELPAPDTGEFVAVQTATIDPHSRTAHFRIEEWDAVRAVPYRVRYEARGRDGGRRNHYYGGVFGKEPPAGSEMVVASLSCHLDLGFPHQGLVISLLGFAPDAVIFSGDQIYEGNAGYGVQRRPVAAATLDYLRKWYQFGWAFREVLRDRPSLFTIDDHDVYHGNIWGAGGRAASGEGAEGQDSGGYKMDPGWVNIVQRTQTSHLPDPFDPTPVKQGIGVYYTDVTYGGVSFAIVEDRKWKSAPRDFLPGANVRNGFAQNPDFDARTQGDAAGAELLGRRQLEFLEQWAADWSGDVRMKVVVSPTLFSSVQTRPRAEIEAGVDRGMSPVPPGQYPPDDVLVQDFDTNGWPQTPRREALLKMRKAFALHVAGDTHLGNTVQYGIDAWNNGSWAVGSPAISNVWPRRWFPNEYPLNYRPGTPRNLGEFADGFGNPVTVHAVANPTELSVEPIAINERAPGYNILVFDTGRQSVRIEAWPRWVDPAAPGARQFDGWPITVDLLDNGYPTDGPVLPPLAELPLENPVIQVADQRTNEIIYTARMPDDGARLRVFVPGVYVVRIYGPDMTLLREIEGQVAQ